MCMCVSFLEGKNLLLLRFTSIAHFVQFWYGFSSILLQKNVCDSKCQQWICAIVCMCVSASFFSSCYCIVLWSFFTLRCDFFNLLQTIFCVDCRARLADVALLLVCWVLVLFILFRLCVTIEMSFYFLIASMWKWRLFI